MNYFFKVETILLPLKLFIYGLKPVRDLFQKFLIYGLKSIEMCLPHIHTPTHSTLHIIRLNFSVNKLLFHSYMVEHATNPPKYYFITSYSTHTSTIKCTKFLYCSIRQTHFYVSVSG